MDSQFKSDPLEISLDDALRIREPSIYLVRVVGHSMVRAGIFDGDLLVVDKGLEAAPGSVVIGVVNQEPMVKRLVYVHGTPVLRSEAKGYPDRFIMEGDDFSIWGVVTHSVHPHGLHP